MPRLLAVIGWMLPSSSVAGLLAGVLASPVAAANENDVRHAPFLRSASKAPTAAAGSGMPGWLRQLLEREDREAGQAPRSWFERWASGPAPTGWGGDGESEEAERIEAGRTSRQLPWTLSSSPSPLMEASRVAPAPAGATWSYTGPEATYYIANENPAQPLKTYQANVTGFAVAPSNPNILYAGTQMGQLNKSTDKGLHWTPLGDDNTLFRSCINAIAVHPNDPNIVYVGNGLGILKSIDGGATWAVDLDAPTAGVNVIAINPTKPETLLVAGNALFGRSPGVGYGGSIARFSYDVAFRPGNSSIAYALIQNAAGDSVQFFKSTNGGNTWSIRRTGWIANMAPLLGARMAVSPAAPDRIYVLALTPDGQRLLRSNDAGESWTTAAFKAYGGDSPCHATPASFDLGFGQGYYDLAIAASPTNADHIVLGTVGTFRSMDGGQTFRSVSSCNAFPIHDDVQEMVCIGGDSWIATDGGVNLSTDFWTDPANFSSRTYGLRGTQVWGFGQGWNEDSYVSGRNHNAIGAWVEGYPAGSFLATGSGEPVTGYINPANSRMSYLSGGVNFGFIWPATFGGLWQLLPVALFPYEGGAAPGDEMNSSEQEWDPRYSRTYYLGRQDGLWRTENNGASFQRVWNHANSGAIEEHIEISRTDPNVIYLTVLLPTSGELWKTVDRGVTWTRCADPPGLSDGQRRLGTIALSGTDPGVLWWCFRNGPDGSKIFKTTDGGASWTNLTTPALDGVVLVNMFHQLGTQGGIYLVGHFAAVLYRNDVMADWVPYNAGLSSHLAADMVWGAIQYPKKLLRLGTTNGIWQVGLYENSSTTLVQPMVDLSVVADACDTLQFESYSVVNGPATYHWSFAPEAIYISNANVRNPRVVLGTPGMHAVTLEITDQNGTTSRTIRNFINAGSVQYADSVIARSSEYTLSGAPAWHATQALGLPDVYPDYGDYSNAWASLGADDQTEYLVLHFPTPAQINFVQVCETFNPGALYRVAVKNPGTGWFVYMWSAPAVPAPQASRVYTARFPDPGYLVDEVQLEFDSPAVPGWNEIDAVGIGYETCSASLVGVPGAPAPVVQGGIEFVRPNPFVASAVIRCTLTRPGRVQAEVYDVLGHRVARLADGFRAAGQHDFLWNGRDAGGRDVASGVYYVRLEAPGVRGRTKVVKLR